MDEQPQGLAALSKEPIAGKYSLDYLVFVNVVNVGLKNGFATGFGSGVRIIQSNSS